MRVLTARVVRQEVEHTRQGGAVISLAEEPVGQRRLETQESHAQPLPVDDVSHVGGNAQVAATQAGSLGTRAARRPRFPPQACLTN